MSGSFIISLANCERDPSTCPAVLPHSDGSETRFCAVTLNCPRLAPMKPTQLSGIW